MANAPLGPVLVVGDQTVDWAILTPPGSDTAVYLPYRWDEAGTVAVLAMPGGVALFTRLLLRLGVDRAVGAALPDGALREPNFQSVARTFTTWATFPETRGSDVGRWRLREFLGRERASVPAPQPEAPRAQVLVIDDANLGFRDNRVAWQAALDALDPDGSILLKLANPLASGPLWDRLVAEHSGQLTLYISLSDLRKEDAAVGGALSWERTAIEVVAAVGRRAELAAAARVVVGIGLAGGVVIERGQPARLVFDPNHLEGDWERRYPGMPFGVGTAVCAALVRGLAGGESNTCASLELGLQFARQLHCAGLSAGGDGVARLEAPATESAEGSPFSTREIPEDLGWTFLQEAGAGRYRAIAEDVLVAGAGADALGVPVGRMGAWSSLDRAEIESIHSIRNIVDEYLSQALKPRPLSIAVFGAPGSGKSFAIKQMAAELARAGHGLQTLEFNVSQFTSADALAAAFQRVRDCAVEGLLPLVFWDEFDSTRGDRELGWLSTFLAPMQDGVFLDGSLIRPIGPAVFVFAGGTHATMAGFKARAEALPAAKATDFLSRLRGFVDVLGPNPAGADDGSFVVRRALLLRQMLQRRAPQIASGREMRIDPGVVNAFLSVGRYVHGARSMEAIVEMSALSGRTRFGRSSLPAAHQLSLHVDADEFRALLDQA